MIRGIHHVAISTPDVERLLGFYRDLLGFSEISRNAWPVGTARIDRVLNLRDSVGRQVLLRAGNACIELFEFAQPAPAPMNPDRPVCDHGHTHLCLDVVDIDSVYRKLEAAGTRFHCPPQNFGSLKATYGRDPDGNVFELQELLDPDSPAQVLR